jgi:hypothetical protein
MSSHSCRALFETTFSALRLRTDAGGRIRLPAEAPDNDPKSNIDKSFWMLRELGRGLALVGLPAREPPQTRARQRPSRWVAPRSSPRATSPSDRRDPT